MSKSKQLSYLLRHNPEDLKMDEFGYVLVSELLVKTDLTLNELEQIVNENNKQRFSFNFDKTKIRANQGHSIPNIILDMKEVTNKDLILYHGTCLSSWNKIKEEGLKKMNRNYVHLTDNLETAKQVGLRYAKNKEDLVIIKVETKQLLENNIKIYISENNVYQIEFIPEEYLTLI